MNILNQKIQTKHHYIYAITNGIDIKIGISADPKRRLRQLNTSSPINLYILTFFVGNRELEKIIHKQFKKIRYNGEWMEVSQELLDYLNSMSENCFIDWDEHRKLRSYLKIKM